MSKHPDLYAKMRCTYSPCEFVSVNPERLRRHLNDHEKGLLNVDSGTSDRKEEVRQIEENQKRNLNSSMEVEIQKHNQNIQFMFYF